MASSGVVSIDDAPATYKSFVWRHFGYPVVTVNGARVTDKTRTICKHCKKISPYTSANTSTMQRHLQNHHGSVLDQHDSQQNHHRRLRSHHRPQVKPAAAVVRTETSRRADPPRPPRLTDRAAEITRDIGIFIAANLSPFSVVENVGFKRLLNTLEPNYTIPTRGHFSTTVVPSLYAEYRARVVQVLKSAGSVAVTTDAWTFRGTLSYVTVTAHATSSAWDTVSVVLRTRPLLDSHSGANMMEVLIEAVSEWQLRGQNRSISIVTSDVGNPEVALRQAGLEPHIQCFAHTVNRAIRAGLGVARVSALLERVRHVVSVFHQNPTTVAVLKSKQKLLQLPCHDLISDVSTRWNSTLDMLSRYLEQQTAIAAVLSSPYLRLNDQIDALVGNDTRDAEDLVRLLMPLKTVTTVLCEDKNPSVSLIVPLKTMIEQSMTPNPEDSSTVVDTKRAILTNLSGTYSGDLHDFLLECTALDPRFRTLSLLDHDRREDVFLRVQRKVQQLQTQTPAAETEQRPEDTSSFPGDNWALKAESGEAESKTTALEGLMEDSFKAELDGSNGPEQVCREVEQYRSEVPLPLSSCPLRWWRDNAAQYPSLSQLAHVCLSIPGTCVPSQRVFSAAGDIINAQRSQLQPEHLDMLIFLNQNLSV